MTDKAACPVFSDLRSRFTRVWVCASNWTPCWPGAPHPNLDCEFRWTASIADRNAARFGLGDASTSDNTDGPA